MVRSFLFFVYTAVMTACILLLGTGCSLQTKSIVKEINKNSTFEIPLLTKADEDLFSEDYIVIPGHGITGYYHKKYSDNNQENPDVVYDCSVIYHVTRYPDILFGKSCVTRVDVTDPAVAVYGFSVGDNVADMQSFLLSKGFKIFSQANHLIKYNKGEVQIRIGVNYEEQTINCICVDINTSNITGAIF